MIRKAIIKFEHLSRTLKDQEIKSEKKINQLKSLIQATLDARDVESLSEEKNKGLTDGEIERIKNDMDLNRKILQNINESKSASEVEKLKESIINGQLKLHRDALLKQLSELKKLQEFLKTNKIVYI